MFARPIWLVLRVLPAEKSPTISGLADSEYVAIEVIIDDSVREPWFPRRSGPGRGIITYPLNKVIH